MEITQVFDDERVRRLLVGSDADMAYALTLIDRHLRNRLCGWLRKHFGALDPEELANAWADTLLSVLQAVRAGRFDAGRPLLPWLCQIAHARAVDQARRARCRHELLATLGQAARAAGVSRHGMAAGPEEQHEIMHLIHEAIETLPARQQRVLQVFVDHYPESRNMEWLRAEVGRQSGRVETLASVKRALQEARAKVGSFLRRKGYTVGEGGDA